ncbi:lipocalin-like domain protein [Burkholderia pseudomallei]|uniref:lipocalin-like domain-containing protein n=1 Tax=Burkholderia pseudomallei TaxID=28450 RepID=UPI000F092E2E|nr:lipocalin-like domain-containing protein [Burkholderia pseudomallei]CAJ3550083.1 lipocalin-like domain protein [Burkholderia pseudomallei]CAJ4934593.1 lipocalin-like domain protein [Burkholderia pseudomallei]CAJ5457549.1 lipocalin-like domain protein [Burkholderia pseudomallei]CAJ5463921.1 lipocalin-like domain protein [Burkholderia pseudomallei]CAJ5502603.1 lipocalin-like domain protein [Burkholderia pseudomallei]
MLSAWTHDSYVEIDAETGVRHAPFGDAPLGFIVYTADGYMSVQLQARERAPFSGDDPYRGTPAEYAQAGRTYLAYAGRFFVDEATRALSHEMAVALFPNWLGQIQTRIVEFPDDTLHLGMPTPLQLNDALKHARLVWRRATPNG